MEILVKNQDETRKFAEEIAGRLKPGDTVALYGDLGAGKTTFVSMVLDILGFEDRVQSPTFVVSRIYGKAGSSSPVKSVNHLDLYRIQSPEEVNDLGLEDYFDREDSLTFIEWPEVAEKFLPSGTIKIFFEVTGENERKINVQNLY